MKKTILLLFTTVFLGCQTNPSNKVMADFDWPEEKLPFFEVIHMQPKNHEMGNFLKNIKEHNEIYHNKVAGVNTFIRYISSGKYAGQYQWIEGPMSMEYLDNKLQIKGHQEHWQENVQPYVNDKGVNHINTPSNYYRVLSHLANKKVYDFTSGEKPTKFLKIQQLDVKQGKMWDVLKILNNWAESDFAVDYSVIMPFVNDGTGNDISIVWHFDSMSQADTFLPGVIRDGLDARFEVKGRQKILKSMGELVTYNGEFIAQIVE
ncbi:MAG: hypothetical protein HN595_06260 [Flavobacteriaceae bacterium]|nr:hypothetical protein [Flavobacteriaceae bacterium]